MNKTLLRITTRPVICPLRSAPIKLLSGVVSRLAGIIIFMLIHCHISYAATGYQLDQLLNKLEAKVTKTKTVQCRFKQLRFLKIFANPVNFQGKLVLERPDKLRWETISPIPSVMIFNGNQGLRCNNDSKPVYFDLERDPVMRLVARQIWAWADSSYRKLTGQYTLDLVAPFTIKLCPRKQKMTESIESIRIVFQDITLQPEQIIISETKGERTELYFSNYILNDPLPSSLFNTCFQK